MVRRSTHQLFALGVGILLLAITTLAELAGWGESGFGALQMILVLIGLASLALGVLPRDGALGRMVHPLIAVFAAAYFSLLLVEIGLRVVTPYDARIDPVLTLRGSVEETPWGFGLKPNWRGLFQDGVVSAMIAVNSLGDRDREPNDDVGRRVLLVGDHVAFGYALNQHETIDAEIERQSEGRIDAYNLGVLSYGPGEAAKKLEATTATRAEHVFYVFNGNDLRDDARFGRLRVWDGQLVPAHKPDGTPYSEEEYRAHAEEKSDERGMKALLSLVAVRELLVRLVDPDRDRVMGPLETYEPEGIEHALVHTLAMKRVAESRGAKFTVVVVPMKGEAAPESYAAPTRSFLDRLEDEGVATLDLHDRLNVATHYFAHDPHLNAEGAKETARAILELLEK